VAHLIPERKFAKRIELLVYSANVMNSYTEEKFTEVNGRLFICLYYTCS
jgi:hypothetical protein